MTSREMYNKVFLRPKNFFELSAQEQWDIDKRLGILDWDGDNLTEEDIIKYKKYFNIENYE